MTLQFYFKTSRKAEQFMYDKTHTQSLALQHIFQLPLCVKGAMIQLVISRRQKISLTNAYHQILQGDETHKPDQYFLTLRNLKHSIAEKIINVYIHYHSLHI